jgi:translocation and assembly module TamA
MQYRCLALLLIFLSGNAVSSMLEYSISGIEGPLLENVNRWLGPPAETEQERNRFVSSMDERIETALQALGYYSPTVDIQIDKSTPQWKLSIAITPNEPIRVRNVDIQMIGAADVDESFSELVQGSELTSAAVLNHDTYETFKRKLQRLGQRRGYFDGLMNSSRIEIEPVAATADIVLHYQSGDRYAYGLLEYDHEQLTQTQLLSLTPIRQGDPYEVTQLFDLQTQLLNTGYFSTVTASPQLAARADGKVPINLDLIPAKKHSVDLGVGYSSDIKERVSATWRTPRVNRQGHSMETRILYSPVNPSIRMFYRIPLTHPLNDVLQLSARTEENEYGDTKSQQNELAAQRDVKASGWVRSFSLRALRESWDVDDINSENDYLLPGVSYSKKERKGPLVDPLAGLSQFYSVEIGANELASDVDIIRAYSRHVWVLPLAVKHRLVGHGELGAALISDRDRAQLAPSLRFFAGGSQSVRGYGYQSIGNTGEVQRPGEEPESLIVGGSRLITGGLEYQYYVNDTWRGSLFLDAGDAFDANNLDLNYGAGAGVHYLTPVGAIKLEVARPIYNSESSWRLHINIGAEF